MNSDFPLTLYYDGACPVCVAEMRNLEARDVHGQLRFVNLDIADADRYPPGIQKAAMMALIHARCADGRLLRGMEVFRLAYRAVGLPWVARLVSLPGIKPLTDALYPAIARNRYRLSATPVRWLFEAATRRQARVTARRTHCDGNCNAARSSHPDKERSS